MYAMSPVESRWLSLHDLAKLVDGELRGPVDPQVRIKGVAAIDQAVPGTVTFCAHEKYLPALRTTQASAILISPDMAVQPGTDAQFTQLVVAQPDYAFALVAEALLADYPPTTPGVHPTAIVDDTAILGDGVSIGPYCVVDAHAEIGDNTRLAPFVTVGYKTRLGRDCQIHSHVAIREHCIIGDRVILQPGVIIGGDGFGYARMPDGWHKIPQLGIVVLEDDVEIGANTCVDRARFDRTIVEKGAKLDNLIQVAHNCRVGARTGIAALTGLSGSTDIGRDCMIGGAVGFAGHLKVGDQAQIGAMGGVIGDVEGGQSYIGIPIMPGREYLKRQAALGKLPDLLKTFRALEKRVKELEAKLGEE